MYQFNHVPADHDYCRFQPVLLSIKARILGMKLVFNHEDLLMFSLKLNIYE